MFQDLEHFVTAHRPCSELISDVGKLTGAGYALRLACVCGVFERWVTPDAAARDLLRSRLPVSPN